MGPGRFNDSFELKIIAISEAVSLAHFGVLVKRNREAVKKIISGERKKLTCEKEAADQYNLEPDEFERMARELQQHIINDEGPTTGADADGDLGEFLLLSLKRRLLKSDFSLYSKLFFVEVTAIGQADAEIEALSARRATLEGLLAQSGALHDIGYSSQGVEWLGEVRAKSAIVAAIKREMCVLEDDIVQLMAQLDHCRASLHAASAQGIRLEGGPGVSITTLKSRCSRLRTRVSRLMRSWTFWRLFDTESGSPTLGWEEEATASGAKLLQKPDDESAAGVTRSFPWDDSETSSSGRHVPRHVLLKYLDTICELLRSREEFNTLLPHDLRRAVRYYVLYAGDIAAVLAKIKEEIAAELAVVRSEKQEEVKARAVDAVRDLLFRRNFLLRRLVYVEEQRRRGDSAVANWYGNGKPLLDVEIPVTTVAEGQEDVIDEFVALPLLAAGGAARAAVMWEPDEDSEDDSDGESE